MANGFEKIAQNETIMKYHFRVITENILSVEDRKRKLNTCKKVKFLKMRIEHMEHKSVKKIILKFQKRLVFADKKKYTCVCP